MRARSGCHCPCEAAAAGTVRTCCRHRGSLAPARRLLVEPAFPGPPAMPSDTRPPDDASSASTRERVGSCAALSRSFLKVAVCMAPDLGSSTDLSAKPSQRRARSGTASVPPGRMVIPATAAKDIAWFSSVALAALWPLLPSTSGFAVFYKTLFYKAHIAHDSTLEHPSIRNPQRPISTWGPGTHHCRGEEGQVLQEEEPDIPHHLQNWTVADSAFSLRSFRAFLGALVQVAQRMHRRMSASERA